MHECHVEVCSTLLAGPAYDRLVSGSDSAFDPVFEFQQQALTIVVRFTKRLTGSTYNVSQRRRRRVDHAATGNIHIQIS